MIRPAIVADTNDTQSTPEQVAASVGAYERHLARAKKLPRFHETRAQIEANQAASHATLRELRKSLRLTQEVVAEAMGMSQSELSRVERRDDMFLSTLERFVSATGGRLTLLVEYDDRNPVTLELHTLANRTS